MNGGVSVLKRFDGGKASRLDINDVKLIGRTYDEYFKMFRLADFENKGLSILDAAGGVSSFCGEGNERGLNITACDPIYRFDGKALAVKGGADLSEVMSKVPEAKHLYRFDRFKNVEELRGSRAAALKMFIKDYSENRGRYIDAELPDTDFGSREFDVVLSSHLLFLYDNVLDYWFHRRAVLELLRIAAKEVRIFPLVNFKGERSPFVKTLVRDVFDLGYGVSIDRVDYEFVRGGNEMLRIIC